MTNKRADEDIPIGYLVSNGDGFRVVGICCKNRTKHQLDTRIWAINILPYSQTCCECGGVLVEGQECGKERCERAKTEGSHTHWCELYSGN